MKKIKLLWEKILNNFKDVFSKFPITMAIVLIVTLISAICLDDFIIDSDTLGKIVFVGIIWVIGTLFSETYFKDKKIIKYIGVALGFLIAIFFNEFIINNNTLFTWDREKTEIILGNILYTYVISLILLTIYKLSKQSNLDIKEYLLNVFSESFIVSITYLVLNLGVSAVSAIFIYLILDGESYEFILRMLVLALGVFYIPSMISVFANTEKIKLNSFVEKLLLYVIFPLTMIAILIIYIYLAKILILQDIPKNTIGRILIAVYLVSIPVWAMVMASKKENITKIAKVIPYIYLPLMILEIYSIFTRIFDYGFTPIRYLCVLFIIFQLISFYIIIVRKQKKLRELIIVGIVFTIIYFISPLNYRVVSNLSQKFILDKYVENEVEFDNCSKEEQRKYRGAYKYLLKEYDGEKYINSQISEDERIKLGSYFYEYDDNDNYTNTTEYIYANKKLEELDISGYSKIYYFEDNLNYSQEVNAKKIEIEYGGNIENIDLSNYIEKFIENNEMYNDEDKYFEENNIIQLNNEKLMYMTHIGFEYDQNYEIEHLNIEGYILEK